MSLKTLIILFYFFLKLVVTQVTQDEGASLVFVFDTTGSMHDDLKQLREGAEMILDTALKGGNVVQNFVFVPFHDPEVGPATVTTDKEIFKEALDMVRVYGGGDCPEKSLTGIQLALKVSSPKSYVYVFTDATSGDHKLVGQVLDAVQRKQSQVVFVLTGVCSADDFLNPSFQVYQQIAAASSGQIFNLNKTSVHKVLEFVTSSVQARHVNLGSSINPAGSNTQKVPVDSSLGDVTVSVSGLKPQIKVVNPSGEQVLGPPKLVTTLDLSEIMVVKVLQPEAGNWTITVGSEEDYSVKVVGQSNLTFDYGFSVEKPTDMSETSYRPLKGAYNHMMISLTQPEVPVHLDYAEIITLNGSVLFEVPLQKAGDYYLTDAFIPPDEFFYVAIKGIDNNQQELRRVGTTAVQAKTPDVPYLSVPATVKAYAHTRVVLRCKIESLVPVSGVWYRSVNVVQPKVTSLQTTTIDYIIEDMKEEHVGRYRCIGRNDAGVSEAVTKLIMLVDPPQVSINISATLLQEGDDVNITCTVYSEDVLKTFQFISNRTDKIDAFDISSQPNPEGIYTFSKIMKSVNENDSGIYTCAGSNKGGASNDSTFIKVEPKPYVQITKHKIEQKLNTIVKLTCLTKNCDIIKWISSNGSIVKETNLKNTNGNGISDLMANNKSIDSDLNGSNGSVFNDLMINNGSQDNGNNGKLINGSFVDELEVNVTSDGVWKCLGIRRNIEVTDEVQITALIKPVVAIEGDRNVILVEGSVVVIICDVVAAPKPVIKWFKEKEEVLEANITQTKANTYKSSITIKGSREVDSNFICIGSNSEGIMEDSIRIRYRSLMKVVEGFHDTFSKLYKKVELHCNISSYPLPAVTWYHNNSILELSPNKRTDKNNTVLYIERVDFEDLGMYSCVGNNEYESVALNGTLSVSGLEIPVISKTNTSQIVNNGNSAVISCRITKSYPKPNIRWMYKNNAQEQFVSIFNTSDITVVSHNSDVSDVTIKNASVKNGGTYRCIAENILGRDVFDIELVIQHAPKLNSDPDDPIRSGDPMEVTINNNVTFSCEAEGLPKPIVMWSKDGQVVAIGSHIHQNDESDLIITNVTTEDTGVYTCKAVNSLGAVGRNFTLIVYAPPKISTPASETPLEILEGTSVELPCHVSGEPTPNVTWTHNGNVLDRDDVFVGGFGIRFIANLTHFGEYTCTATNRYGKTAISHTVYIWVPPSVKPPLESSVNALVGGNVSLQCDVIGFPIPSVQWAFQNELLTENSSQVSFNQIGNLYIQNASVGNEGLYACVAENIAGSDHKYVYVKVYEAPKILEDSYTGPYLATTLDTELSITCDASGRPKPVVSWGLEDLFLDNDPRYSIEGDGTLKIKSPTEDMSGNYTCTATNMIGSDKKTVAVQIFPILSQLQPEESHTNVKLLEHSTAHIRCPIRAGDSDTVKWYKNAILLSTGYLHIPNVTRDLQTSYACVVSNAVASAHSTVNIDVEYPPTFIKDKDNDEEVNYVDFYKSGNENYKKNELKSERKLNKTVDLNKERDKAVDTKNKENTVDLKNEHENTIYSKNELQSTRSLPIEILDDDLELVSEKEDEHNKFLEAVEGEDVYLDCRVDAKPAAKVKWFMNSKPLYFENKHRLKLINVHQTSSGVYKCVANNVHGTVIREFNVNVLVPPFISHFDMLDVSLMEGVNATLECNAKGYPEPHVYWSYNNPDWHNQDTSLVANITSKSEGIFRCDARNKAGSTHIVYRVNVLSMAKIDEVVSFRNGVGEIVDRIVEAELSKHIRISCKASGKPAPIVKWLRNGRVLGTNSHGIEYADLTLDVEASSGGRYTCVASNEAGFNEKTVRIEVLEPPKIFYSLLHETADNTINMEVLSGQAYYLHCHPYGTPIPEIYWFREDLPLRIFDDSIVSSDFGEVLEIKEASIEQSGRYTCVARNKVGNTSLSYMVNVLEPPPTLKESFKSIKTRFGRPLTLECPVQGTPAPNVMWIKHPYTEITGGERVNLADDGVSLTINSSIISDSGNYSCIMSNKVGAAEFIFSVTIEKPPSIVGNSDGNNVENHRVALMRSLVLKCEAEGHPMPEISWLKDTQKLSSSPSVQLVLGNRLVAVWRAAARAAGQYVCVAAAPAGSAHRRYNVQVEVPGKWTAWSQWGFCNVTCGLGHQTRHRACQYIDDDDQVYDKNSESDRVVLDESACKGPANERRKCHMPPCEEDKSSPWSPWARWSPCSASCGAGSQARTRRCRARHCAGDNVQLRKCPDLPKCETPESRVSDNEVFDTNEVNAFPPEAVFESTPQITDSIPEDVDQFSEPLDVEDSSSMFDVNVTYNMDGSEPGPCAVGFTYNTLRNTCDDVDECLVESNTCHATQVCVNTPGGFRCGCPPGYRALAAGQRCMDINECSLQTSRCEFACVNTAGGYVCACPRGARLHADRHHCYTVSTIENIHSGEEINPEYMSTSLDYPARYKHIR